MENDLSKKLIRFENDPQGKDACLQRELKISNAAMNEIRRKRTKRYTLFADKLADISILVKDAMLEADSKQDKTFEREFPLSSYFTCTSLAALAFDDWSNPRALSTRVSEAIVKEYKEDRKGLATFLGFKESSIPVIHLFRQEIGIYTGNLEDTKMVWKNIDSSDDDWLYSIQLPVKIDERFAFILGVIWADGCYNANTKEIQLSGRNKDGFFYAEIVKPLLEDIFSKKLRIDDNREGEKEVRETIRIHLQSTALCSLLIDELGFPKKKDEYSILDFDAVECYRKLSQTEKQEIKKQYLAGVISAMGRYYHNRNVNKHIMVLYDYDRTFVQSLDKLSNELGLHPRYFKYAQTKNGKMHTRLIFHGPYCRQLYLENYVKNPELHAHASLVEFL